MNGDQYPYDHAILSVVDAKTPASTYLLESDEMEESRNESNTDNSNRAREIFRQVNRHLENAEKTGLVWEIFPPSTVKSETDNERAIQQHLISSVIFRWIETENRNEWDLENVWDNVYIRQLDDIGQEAEYEWLPENYHGHADIQAAMAENMNIVLVRSMIDWSRLDGSVWSQQIVWSGSFAGSDRILQLLEGNSDTTNLIQVRGERFDLHPHLREQYIVRHGDHPVAAAMAAVDSSPTVIISTEPVGKSDGEGDELLCVICHDMLSIEDAKQLPCNHLFHRNCLLKWFYVKLECPLCRDEFQCHTASTSPTL